MLPVEEVARGLGFTEIAKSGNISIKWIRLNKYLRDLSSTEVSMGDFIPENVFYMLCGKASNETAREFQRKVADILSV